MLSKKHSHLNSEYTSALQMVGERDKATHKEEKLRFSPRSPTKAEEGGALVYGLIPGHGFWNYVQG